MQFAGLNLDYSKNRINQTTVKLLGDLTRACELPNTIQVMFNGEHINRSALHMVLRIFSGESILVGDNDAMPEVQNTLG